MFLVRIGAVSGYERLLAEAGVNPVTLLRELGLDPIQMRDPDAYIAYDKMAELLELCAMTSGDALFGLKLASSQTSSVLGDLLAIVSQEATLERALSEVEKYLYLHARGVRLSRWVDEEQLQITLHFEFVSARGMEQLVQLSTGHLVNFLVELLNIEKHAIALQLRQPAPPPEHRRWLQGGHYTVAFKAVSDGICIPASWMKRRVHRDEHALQNLLQDYLRRLQARYPDRLQDQVRDVIRHMLPSGDCRLSRVAAALDVHPRVLQSRLAAQHVNYSQLLREERMRIAEAHLLHGSGSVTDLALNLGFAETAVFSREFKKWSGVSPRKWRQRQTAR